MYLIILIKKRLIKVNLGEFNKNTFIVCNNNLIGIVKPNTNANKLDTYLDER